MGTHTVIACVVPGGLGTPGRSTAEDVIIPIRCGKGQRGDVSEITVASALLPLASSFHHQPRLHGDPARTGGAEWGEPDPAVHRGHQHHLVHQASALGALL